MDRFLMRIGMEDMTRNQELSMVERFLVDEPLAVLDGICGKDELVTLQARCREVYDSWDLLKYMIEIVHATRKHSKIMQGVSPRGALAFVRAAQGFAMTEGRGYVTPEDIKNVASPVLAHRLTLSVPAEGVRYEEEIIQEVLGLVRVPVEDWEKR